MPRLKLLILFSMLFFTGCASVPFKDIIYVSMLEVDPQQMRQEFKDNLAQEMEIINSIVFQYKWQSFAALGYSRLDLNNGTFKVSCMNPVGIKLFELEGNREKINAVFVLKELLQRGDLPRAVGEDIRRIYFDFTPEENARVHKEKYRITFTQKSGRGKLQYVFAGPNHWLIEKHYSEGKHNIWSVFYYDYLENLGKLYPSAIILKHRRFGYNLIVRLKEVRVK